LCLHKKSVLLRLWQNEPMMNRRKKVIWENFVKGRFKPSDREAASKTLTDKCAYAAAALTAIPIPATEVLGVMPIHVGMVTALGHIHDKDISADSASKLVLRIAATVGLSLVGSRVATTAAKVIMPGFGGIVAAPFMFAELKDMLGQGLIDSDEFSDTKKRILAEL
jgi:uncharacterized protein (DUF697 family)